MENYYDDLCTKMYEVLHATPPQDELDFYLSYAKTKDKILEPLCGNGRFLIPFVEKGYDICGNDLSQSMLDQCLKKCPEAQVECCDIMDFATDQKYNYIFIPSGSVGLFTDMEKLTAILQNFYDILTPGGKLVFAVDTTLYKAPDHEDYQITRDVKTEDGKRLVLKIKSYYDEKTHTQYQPQVYELYDGDKLLQSEEMDFRIHLYGIGEMDEILNKAGFSKLKIYTDYDKNSNIDDQTEFLLYECEK